MNQTNNNGSISSNSTTAITNKMLTTATSHSGPLPTLAIVPKKRTIVGATGGTHGIGKTTLVKVITPALQAMGYKVLNLEINGGFTSPEREAIAKGFPLNEAGNFDSQYYVLANNIKYDLEARKKAELEGADFIFYDRTVVDPIAYMNWTKERFTDEQLSFLKGMAMQHLARYPVDVIFVPQMLGTIDNDGVRSINEKFQLEVAELFDEALIDVNDYLYKAKKPKIQVERISTYSNDKRASVSLRATMIIATLLGKFAAENKLVAAENAQIAG